MEQKTNVYIMTVHVEILFLKAYSDASWGNAENGKSGGAVFIGNSLILWKGKKQ